MARIASIDACVSSQSTWQVNDVDHHRAELRVGTSVAEMTANFLFNRHMAKSQQMQWSRRAADLLLQVGAAAYKRNLGSLGSGMIGSKDKHV